MFSTGRMTCNPVYKYLWISYPCLSIVVIGVPTDTIYGIAGLVQNPEAVARIYNIKVKYQCL